MRNLRITRNIALGIKNLLLHKLRSVLTMLGVVFGVGSVVAMLSVGEGASKDALERIRKLGSNNIILTSQKAMEEEGGASAMRQRLSVYGLLYEDEARIKQTFKEVTRTVPVKQVRREGRMRDVTLDLRVVGTVPDWFDLVNRTILAGRVIKTRDIENKATVCVLTEFGARRLLATEGSIGQSLRIGSDYFEVIGIVRSEQGSGGVQTPDQEVDAYIPLTLARERYGDINTKRSVGSFERERVELHSLILQCDTSNDVERVADGVKSMLERFHKKVDYRISVPLELLRQAEATKRTFNIVLGSIAGISLLVGGIGIMNIMLASVTERTKEIGIRRAIGAKRRQIIGQFLVETMTLSTIGGLIGVGIGVAIPVLITVFAKMPTVVTPWSLVLSVGISMAIGVFFGLYPAMRAANLDPIQALRHE